MTKKISPPVLTGLRESEANFAAFAGDDIGGLRFERQEIDGMDMLGYLRVRAWDARREQRKRRHRQHDERHEGPDCI